MAIKLRGHYVVIVVTDTEEQADAIQAKAIKDDAPWSHVQPVEVSAGLLDKLLNVISATNARLW